MLRWHALQRVATALMLLALGSLPPSVQANAGWRSDWVASSPASLYQYFPSYPADKPSVAAAFSAQGDVLFGSMSSTQADYQIVRMAPDGTLRWASNVYQPFSISGAYVLLANADGGAYLALGAPDYGVESWDSVVRLDASGMRMWSREVPAGWLTQVALDRFATAGCTRLTMLDAANGNVIWQRQLSASTSSCISGGVVADGRGNVYTTTQIGTGSDATGFRTIKWDASGNEVWKTESASAGGGSAIGIGDAMLFVGSATDLRAIRQSDGTVAWSAPFGSPSRVRISDDGVPEPIVAGQDSVLRLAADTGQPRWTSPLSGVTNIASVTNGAVLAQTSVGVTRLDAASGAITWSIALPGNDPGGNALTWLAFGGFDGTNVLAVARAWSFNGGAPPAFLQRIGFADGALTGVVPVPAVAQSIGTGASGIVDDAGNVIGVGVSQQTDHSVLHLRRLDGVTGTALWEIAEPIDIGPGWVEPPQPQMGVNGATIAVAFPLNAGRSVAYGPGLLRVDLYDRATGERRWRVMMRDDDQQYTWVSDPVMDGDGNVVVAIGMAVGSSGSERQTLYKLSAATGAVLWRFDNWQGGMPGMQVFPQDFAVLGSDVLLVGPFQGSTATLRRLSGVDGSILWSSTVFSPNGIGGQVYEVDSHHVVVFGIRVYGDANPTVTWAKLDADSGVTLWTNAVPYLPCLQGCYGVGDQMTLPGGDILFVGERDYMPSLQRIHNDGSGVIDRWNLAPNDPALESWISRVQSDPTGAIRLYLRRGHRNHQGSVTFLAGFDITTGALLGQQALSSYNPDPLAAAWYPHLLQFLATDRLLASTYSVQPPLPTTMGAALLDTRVTAHGDLSATITTDRAHVVPGDVLGFHLKATYSGDAPIQGAHVIGSLPWSSGIASLTCTPQAASNCVIDSRSGSVSATFDMQPGGSIDIAGQVLVLDAAEATTLSATTYGPVGLSEQDTLNNFAHATITQSLFLDGFENR